MANFDENTDIIEQADVPFISTAIKYGLIGGGLLTAWTLLAGIFGLIASTSLNMVAGLVIYIGIVYAAIKHHRDGQLGGYISMGRAFVVGLVTCLIMGIIGGIANYVYMNFIDPGAVDEIIAATTEMMEGFGLNEEQMEEALKGVEDGFTFGKLMLNNIISSGVFGAIISGITGAIMKKEAPMV